MRIPALNFGLCRLAMLNKLFDEPIKIKLLPVADGNTTWLGWGAKASAKRARLYAKLSGGQAIQLEDGFLRSYGTGEHFPPLSLVVDNQGIYYDSTQPSALERLLNSPVDILSEISSDVQRAKSLILEHRLSKYNHAPDCGALLAKELDSGLRRNDNLHGENSQSVVVKQLDSGLRQNDSSQLSEYSHQEVLKELDSGLRRNDNLHGENSQPVVVEQLDSSLRQNDSSLLSECKQRVLVIDQTVGDMSVTLGAADANTFAAMLAAAYAENPQATIYVKTHPEVTSGRKGGYLTHVQENERTVVLRDAINPLSLIEQMDRVYVVTSTMGFEAVLAGKPVSVFGLPWYAGWGVTDDRQACERRRTRQRSVDELFAAAYFHYARYLNPVTHQRGTIFDVIDWLKNQRIMAYKYSGKIIAVGFRRWKAANIRPLLSLNQKQVMFVPNAKAAKTLDLSSDDCLVYWGREAPPDLLELAKISKSRVLRMEDGFMRSVGLGSDLIRPLSIVLDECGIYFDPTQPSDLEKILNTVEFSEDELEVAKRINALIVKHGITKYNLEPREEARWDVQGREVILVPGQVEDDASIIYGCTDIKTNLDLLKAARAAHPAAFIVYKPHPDVMSGNRVGKLAFEDAKIYADYIETRLSVVSCIESCDVVHTMTSLTGFDALLRGKRVVVYGQPFYAGWGLTEDVLKSGVAFERRLRRLTLNELIAGTLLRYPIYWDWDLKGYTTCEAVINRIIETRDVLEKNGGLEKLRLGYLRRQWRKIVILFQTYLKR